MGKMRPHKVQDATKEAGAGWAFGLHTALDQTGGMSGPLLVALLLAVGDGYRHSFAMLIVPALISLALLVTARRLYPNPRKLELRIIRTELATWPGFGRAFRIYTIAAALVAAGFADFALVGFHFARAHIVPVPWIPVLYAAAMAAEGITSLALGRLLDRFGPRVAVLGITLAALASSLLFLGSITAAAAGVVL
ncbi:MFS transporter [Acidiphilium acidophilum]|uniref:MFS transporter n=1 Tax=Acidiphilium acidophilum TaxID=76588 RepID=A0AAW9DK26_ACIAO|nr:MFS transporter [Acidiphilium acidophilum]MDX5929399.1 hypothetical protein [Acidiphilium acidophilum]GBR76951.1 hypothetical protein AA700_0675 [Acidiphilium acidophilum DSM 700]